MNRTSTRILAHARAYWFLIGIVLVVSVGLLCHQSLGPLAGNKWLMNVLAFSVMAMMVAPIPLEMVKRAVSHPWPAVLASLINLAFVPVLGWFASFALPGEIAGGLIVASAVPSTLTSAAVLARKAGGDDSVSIFTTLITNMLCVVVTPFWITVLLGTTIQLSLLGMIANLSGIVLLPALLVQIARSSSARFCAWAYQSRMTLSMFCQFGILVMVLMGSIQMGVRWSGQSESSSPTAFWQISLVVLLGLAVHLIALYTAWSLSLASGLSRSQAKAVSFSGSQKTLMIGLNLSVQCGVNILPMLTYHIFQLIADAFIAEKWANQSKSSNN